MKKILLPLIYFALTIGCDVAPTVRTAPIPVVNITSPAPSLTVSGMVELDAAATDSIPVAGVQFQVDGSNIGSQDTAAPYHQMWDTKTVANGTHMIRAVATDSANVSTTSSAVQVTVNNVAPAPIVTITAPAAGMVNGLVSVSADAGSSVGITGVQFQVNGVDAGPVLKNTPYTLVWDTTLIPNGIYALTAIATASDGQTATSAFVSVTVSNVPTIAITAPLAGATVNGAVSITADAGPAAAVTSVQFRVDGANQGTAQASPPYILSWDTTLLKNGPHTITAIVTSNDGQSATATAAVTVSNAPTVSISAPLASATVSGSVSITANAGPAAAVTGVQFQVDGVNQGAAVLAPPYLVSWDTALLLNGSHILTAVVTSNDNQTATSTPVAVTVSNAPTVAITAPLAGATVSGAVSITANAGPAAAVTSVQFKVDGASQGAAQTSPPYLVSWDTTLLSNGPHTITAIVTSNDGQSATATAAVTVSNAPTVAITAPLAGATVNGSVQITANAGPAAAVTNVQFKVDGNNQGAAQTLPPYALSWDTTLLPNGPHTITAIVTSNDGQSATATAAVTVSNAPTVAITAPLAGATVNGSVQITANAGPAAAVTSVQFKVDGANQGAAQTSPPYLLSWDTTLLPNGPHILTAVVTSNDNQTATSTPVTVTVSNAPTVAITAPLAGATVNGSVSITADAGPAAAVTSVQFKVDGANQGAAQTSPPYLLSWDTTLLPNGPHILTAVVTSNDNQTATSTPVTVTVSNAPTVAITAPLAGATVSGSLSITADAGPAAAVTSVQFKVDGNNEGAAQSSPPYLVSWDTTLLPNGPHILTAVVTSNDNQTATSTPVTVTVSNAPTVAITAPLAGATVSGSVSITANAGPAAAVTGVQFKVDGNNQGAAQTSPPYVVSWDTTLLPNESHTLSAIVTSNDNQTATSTVVVNVKNNLIPNPSLEDNTVDPLLPDFWKQGGFGTNTAVFSYLSTGHSGGHSIKVELTTCVDGAAYWYTNVAGNIPVTAGQTYEFSDYYQSNVQSQIDAQVTMSDGTTQSLFIGTAPAAANWTKFDTTFKVPAGAVSIIIFHNISSVGWLITDDYSLSVYQNFNRPIVTLTFDDGLTSFYNNGVPLLQTYGFTSTDFIISGIMDLGYPDYMTSTQVAQLHTFGHEIGSHTVDHTDLTTLSLSALDAELADSQTTLQTLIGVPVTDFATPYGAANAQVLTEAAKYYATVRGVDSGFNSRLTFSPYNILVQNIVVDTPVSQVKAWIDEAIATNSWLVLVYHAVDATLDPVVEPYNTRPADLEAELQYLKLTGVSVQTINQALTEITPQL